MGNAISSFGMNAAPDHVMAWPRLVLGDWHIHGKFLIVPASPDTARLQTFQIMQLPLRGGLPSMLFEQLLKRIRDYSQTDGLYGGAIHKLREFYFFGLG
ncbi:hypothetical protein ACOSOMT5_P0398 [Acidiphilium sp. MT5]